MSHLTAKNHRGVIYTYWGTKVEKELKRSLDSLKKIHPELPVEPIKLPEGSDLVDKARMLDLSPFETTLFLDTDNLEFDMDFQSPWYRQGSW